MFSHEEAVLALRTQALTLSVATTGSMSLSATDTGYARAAGDFAADGFTVGMELSGTGFGTASNNGVHVITGVSTLALACDGCSPEAAAAGRTLAVGLPTTRAWENKRLQPTVGRWYVEEDYAPGPAPRLLTCGPSAMIEVLPVYFLKLYGLSNTGILALYRVAKALLNVYPPRTAWTLTSGDVLRVRTDQAPYPGGLLPIEGGWSVITITVPLRAETANTI